ncbi:hypothetical protein DFQ28_011462 [Apophysomyces sp. BC1034]|nr:hypothetical protein DFQ29_009917 [Apophysomyces sp. BC1021]KAG0171275.1 hypothetical protein DFQ30_001245 [Apophysomyces sp. BC1015]KAG0184286.1 hypothetical protein DFQ28_011462 [Apophysomyces sp. BC1034]
MAAEQQELEYSCLALQNQYEAHTSEIDTLQKDIQSLAETVEQSHQTLVNRADDMTRHLDEIRAAEQEVARIDALVGNQNLLTAEAVRAQVDELTDGYVKLNMLDDDHRETIYDLTQRIEEGDREIKSLLAEMLTAEAEASQARESNGHKDEELERQKEWYDTMIDLSRQLQETEHTGSEIALSVQNS